MDRLSWVDKGPHGRHPSLRGLLTRDRPVPGLLHTTHRDPTPYWEPPDDRKNPGWTHGWTLVSSPTRGDGGCFSTRLMTPEGSRGSTWDTRAVPSTPGPVRPVWTRHPGTQRREGAVGPEERVRPLSKHKGGGGTVQGHLGDGPSRERGNKLSPTPPRVGGNLGGPNTVPDLC